MKYTIFDAIQALNPTEQPNYTVKGETYADILWEDTSITKPTESQLNTKLAELVAAEPMRLLRLERDRRLMACDYLALADQTMPDAWKTYRQALRDLPSTSTPKLTDSGDLDDDTVTWPTEPS